MIVGERGYVGDEILGRHVRDDLQPHPAAVAGVQFEQLALDDAAGRRLVGDDIDRPGAGVEHQHQVDGGPDVRILVDPGIVPAIGNLLRGEPVDAAEYHRDLTEDVVAEEQEKVEGVVVGGDDQVESGFPVLGRVQGTQGGGIDGAVDPFGAHELDEEAAVVPVRIKVLEDALELLVRPFVPLMIGVEDQHILLVGSHGDRCPQEEDGGGKKKERT